MRRILGTLLFAIAVLLVTELSFRFYLYGAYALLPAQMNSMTQIHDSGLVQRAQDPEVYYELKPNMNSWYKGKRFKTNSAGLRDKEYMLEKEPGVFRVAVLGSSWSMGSGIEAEETWHSQLETELNSEAGNRRYEFINFAVDQYGLGEIIATLEHKVPLYDPDLIIVTITYYTPTVLWRDPQPEYILKTRRNPLFESHALQVLDHRLGLGVLKHENITREHASRDDILNEQAHKALTRLEAFHAKQNIPVAIARLAYSQGWSGSKAESAPLFDGSEHIYYFDLLDDVRNYGYELSQLRVSIWDNHPNALTHSLFAASLKRKLRDQGLLQ